MCQQRAARIHLVLWHVASMSVNIVYGYGLECVSFLVCGGGGGVGVGVCVCGCVCVCVCGIWPALPSDMVAKA
jgi:hypothetical protein